MSPQQAVGRRQATALLRACLRGEQPRWPDAAEAGLGLAVLEECAVHGVGPLVYDHLGGAADWPRETVDRLREHATASAAWETHHQSILTRVLCSLSDLGLEPVLLKGTMLAYGCYGDPALRVRGDTDLLVPEAARAQAESALQALGFRRGTEVSGDVIRYQATYGLRDRLGLIHAIDLHWRINNSEVLARLFSHAELSARALPLPSLGPEARGTCPVDALLLACMHREVHREVAYWVDGVAHFSADRLIWLYDLHLLARELTPDAWNELVALARAKGLSTICNNGLARTAELLGTSLPTGLHEALKPGSRFEKAHLYLSQSALRRQLMDFRALEGIGPKLRFLRELFFPPSAYMRARFAGVRPGWLPWLYLRRAFAGLASRLRSAWLRGSRAP